MERNRTVSGEGIWSDLLTGDRKAELEAVLPSYVRERRWFGGKARTIDAIRIAETFPFDFGDEHVYLTLLHIEYRDGGSQTYMLPLSFASGNEAATVQKKSPNAVVIELGDGLLYDASADARFASALLDAIATERHFSGPSGEIVAWPSDVFRKQAGKDLGKLEPKILGAEQSNTSIKYGDRFILKLYRRLEEGTNPDLEIGLFLTERAFTNTPLLAGAMEYRRHGRDAVTLGILQSFVANMGDAWQYTLNELSGYFTAASTERVEPSKLFLRQRHPLDLAGREVPEHVSKAIGDYLDAARLLGARTAEMHLALSSGADISEFAPEPFTLDYQRDLAQSMKGLLDQAVTLLGERMDDLPDRVKAQARTVVLNPEEFVARFRPLAEREVQATRTRVHGDYHLGQVLYTGKDFMIIDFEGEPIRSLPERKQKHSPLKDVAGMLRSFHYAAYAALFEYQAANTPVDIPPSTDGSSATVSTDNKQIASLEDWADAWHIWVNAAFLGEYLNVAQEGNFLPTGRHELQMLLDTLILEKAIYELIYELNNRPTWVRIPLQGVMQLVE